MRGDRSLRRGSEAALLTRAGPRASIQANADARLLEQWAGTGTISTTDPPVRRLLYSSRTHGVRRDVVGFAPVRRRSDLRTEAVGERNLTVLWSVLDPFSAFWTPAWTP